METLCFDSSVETWLRQTADGDSHAWLHPSLRGLPRIEKPPLLIWLNMAAWHGLDPATASVEQLALRARMVTVLLLLAGAAAAGFIVGSLAGTRAGLLALLVTGSFSLTIKYGHYATYDAQLMGWTGLALAAALWWYHQTIDMLGDAVTKNALCGEYLPVDESQKHPVFIYLMLPGLLLPWSGWWGLACRQPFCEPDNSRRRAAWFAGGWFAVTLLLVCLWPMRQERYLLPILPAAGVMTALCIDSQLARYPAPLNITWLRRLWAGTWIFLALAAGGVAAYLAVEPWLVDHRWIGERVFDGIASWQSLVTGGVLIGLCAAGWWLLRRQQVFAAHLLLGLWICGFSTLCYFGYSQARHQRYAGVAAAEKLRSVSTSPRVWCSMFSRVQMSQWESPMRKRTPVGELP